MTPNTNLKAFITWLAGAVKQGMLAYEDKKITLQEVLGFLPLAMMVSDLIPKAEAAWDEVQNADTLSIVNTLDHVEKELNYLKPETIAKVRNIFGAVMFGAAAVSGFKTITNDVPPVS